MLPQIFRSYITIYLLGFTIKNISVKRDLFYQALNGEMSLGKKEKNHKIHFTGSYPPLFHGLHLLNLFIDLNIPIPSPYF